MRSNGHDPETRNQTASRMKPATMPGGHLVRSSSFLPAAARLLKQASRDPLFHFAAMGLILLIASSALSPARNENTILVNDDALVDYMQYRAIAFNDAGARTAYERLSKEEKSALADAYLQDEVLYREARRLGLDNSDYAIRKLLIQKLQFVAEASFPSEPPPADALLEYYHSHQNEFSSPALVSFKHVFFSGDSKEGDETMRARSTLVAAERHDISLEGDFFPYETSLINRTRNQVADIFGAAAADQIFSETAPLNKWIGPVQSDHGAHLIFISARRAQSTEPFEKVKDIISDSMQQAAVREQVRAYADQLLTQYHIENAFSSAAAATASP